MENGKTEGWSSPQTGRIEKISAQQEQKTEIRLIRQIGLKLSGKLVLLVKRKYLPLAPRMLTAIKQSTEKYV